MYRTVDLLDSRKRNRRLWNSHTLVNKASFFSLHVLLLLDLETLFRSTIFERRWHGMGWLEGARGIFLSPKQNHHANACKPESLLISTHPVVRGHHGGINLPKTETNDRGCIRQEAKGKCTSDHVEGAPGTGRRVGVLPHPSLALAGHSRHAVFWAPASRWFRTSARPSALEAPHQRLPDVGFPPMDSCPTYQTDRL